MKFYNYLYSSLRKTISLKQENLLKNQNAIRYKTVFLIAIYLKYNIKINIMIFVSDFLLMSLIKEKHILLVLPKTK